MSDNALKGVLSLDEITELMGKGRVRGTYNLKLAEFVESDDPAVDVKVAWSVEFGKKEATTLYQGFNNVLNKDEELKALISVRQTDGHVYLLHNERVAVMVAAAAENGK